MKYRVAIGPSSFAAKDEAPLKLLESSNIQVVPNPFGRRLTEAEIMGHLEDIDGLIAGLEPLNRTVLSSFPRLRAVARVGIGMDNVDVKAANELGIKVSNTPDEPALAVAEMTLATMLTLCRQVLSTNAAMHAGNWQKSIGFGLIGTKVLLVGYGHIGRRVGKLLRDFGAEVLVCDPLLSNDALVDGEQLVSLPEGLAQAKVVSLHAGGNEVVLGRDEFEQMMPGAILLNSARGELVDEEALIQALESGTISGAWFDVFWQEPYQGPLLKYEQVLLTPHISTYTRQCRLSMEMAAVKNLIRDLGI